MSFAEQPESDSRQGLYQKLCIVEPDDDPLSCLLDEEHHTDRSNDRSKGRYPRRLLVAAVDPALAVSIVELHR